MPKFLRNGAKTSLVLNSIVRSSSLVTSGKLPFILIISRAEL